MVSPARKSYYSYFVDYYKFKIYFKSKRFLRVVGIYRGKLKKFVMNNHMWNTCQINLSLLNPPNDHRWMFPNTSSMECLAFWFKFSDYRGKSLTLCLHMVTELQLQWMGIEIDLLFQIGLAVFPHKMVYKNHRNNQWDESLAVLVNDFHEFLFLIGREVLLEMAHYMVQDVGVLRH